MIKSKEEYYSILEILRELNFNKKLSKNLQAKLEAFEEMEELVNLTIPVVVGQSEQLKCEHINCYMDNEGFDVCDDCGKTMY